MTDFRALCAQIAESLDTATDPDELGIRACAAVAGIRAALAKDQPKLTPRQQLLDEISDRLCAALQGDLEHGVSCLNARAAEDFQRNYPELNKTIAWINDLHSEEMPDDY